MSHCSIKAQPQDPQTVSEIQSRPPASTYWLNSPAWIDGAIDPPRFYYTHEEIDATLRAYGIDPATRRKPALPQELAPRDPTSGLPVAISTVTPQPQLLEPAAPQAQVPAPAGYIVNVTMIYSVVVPATGRSKAAPKKNKMTRMGHATLTQETPRTDFIKVFFDIHEIGDKFSPGLHSGPEFKFWWTGASGGKGGAPSIQTDQQFAVALQALLKKDMARTVVCVEFDVDELERYRIRQPLPASVAQDPSTAGDEELAYGTRVPQVSDFSETSQLHGRFVLELKKRWPCQAHPGEHGEMGFCYVPPSGEEHIRLNPLRFKAWAAAIAAGDATKHEPPNVAAFDGARDGRITAAKPRGRTGPYPASSAPSTSTSDSNRDMMTLLMASLIPVITGFSRKREASRSPERAPSTPKRAKAARPPYSSPDPVFSTPKRSRFGRPLGADDTPSRTGVPSSPLPEPGHELRNCLRAFAELEGIDFTPFEVAMRMEDFTPDIIPDASNDDLIKIIGCTTGKVVRLKTFCKYWELRHQSKILAAAAASK